MSVIDTIDNTIVELIEALVAEHNNTRFLERASDERKAEIVEQIAKLRASMNPQCNCKKD